MSTEDTTFTELVDGIPIVMLTTPDVHDDLHGRPMTVQRVDEDGTVWFLVDPGADWRPFEVEKVNLAFVDDTRWISATGHAQYVTDEATLEDLGDPVSDTYLNDVSPAALRIMVERADYWSGPGRLRQLVRLGTAAVSGHQPDMGERGVVRP
jgi:general stress protein 26